MINTKANFGITQKDAEKITAIIDNTGLHNLNIIYFHASKSIKNITVNHALFIGYLIGQIQATEKTLETISNNLQPCQRQN